MSEFRSFFHNSSLAKKTWTFYSYSAKKASILMLFLAMGQCLSARSFKNTDSIGWTSGLLPVGLMTTGAIVSGSPFEHRTQTQFQSGFQKDMTVLDNSLLFVPTIQMYAGHALGLSSKHDARDQTKYALVANGINLSLTYLLKLAIQKNRPNNQNRYSMPSGHTSTVFTNATILMFEYREQHPVYGYSGYFFGSAVGSLRMLHNKHWVSDVLVGAGLGIGVATLVYNMKWIERWHPFKVKKDWSFHLAPSAASAVYHF